MIRGKNTARQFFLVLLFVTLINPGKSQINIQDSLALVNFYNATNGQNWANNTNWLTGPVITWYGIETLNGFVKFIFLENNNLTGNIIQSLCEFQHAAVINLSGNNLTGTIPECAGQIPQLNSFILSFNHLTSPIPLSLGDSTSNHLVTLYIDHNEFDGAFPDTLMKKCNFLNINIDSNRFISFPQKTNGCGFSALNLRNNCLTFKDIIFYKLIGPVQNFTYYPQDSILQGLDTTILLGSSLGMDSWVDTCNQNVYSWRKNGNWLNWNSTNSSWAINNAQFSDSGYYTCQVTNPVVNGLALQRRMIHVHVADTITGIPALQEPKEVSLFYNVTDSHLKINMNFKFPTMARCYLYDRLGRKILRLYEGTTNTQELHYYLKDTRISKGMYIVKLEAKGKFYTKKVFVE